MDFDSSILLSAQRAAVTNEISECTRLFYLLIARVNLKTGKVYVLHHPAAAEADEMHEFEWGDYLASYAGNYFVEEERGRACENFSIHAMRTNFDTGTKIFSRDYAALSSHTQYKYLTVLAFLPEESTSIAYVLVRSSGSDPLMHSIINQYVYVNCDFFIYLDARHNSYTTFYGSTNTPLPPEQSDNYEATVNEYTRAHVAPEDREMVIREMRLSHVVEQLDKNGVHTFTCGIVDEHGYRRKRIKYLYHDKANGMILLSRNDIHLTYLEEQEHRRQLELALMHAQRDSLTKLLNAQTIRDRVDSALRVPDGTYALLFVDLDNFKGVNDQYGHLAGDEVLRGVAEALRENEGKDGMAARIGGDEFVLFVRIENEDAAVDALAQRIMQRIRELCKDTCSVTGSIGIAIAPRDGQDYTSLVNKADAGMYRAKSSGKDQYCFIR